MIHYKSEEEIELIRQSSLLVGKTLAEVAKLIRPGVSTLEMDRVAETFIRDNGAVPGFLHYRGFPNTLCISVNEQVVHGIPGDRQLEEGDLVSVDCGVILNGYYGDSAYTFAVGEMNPAILTLMRETKHSLDLGVEQAVVGKRLGDIGHAIQSHVEARGYTVVRDLVGHGIGKHLHEAPEVLNYGKRGSGLLLREGLVIYIEPMINLGSRHIVQEKDGWTIRTSDRKPSAHYEHTIAVRKGNADVLSTFEYIEKVLDYQI